MRFSVELQQSDAVFYSNIVLLYLCYKCSYQAGMVRHCRDKRVLQQSVFPQRLHLQDRRYSHLKFEGNEKLQNVYLLGKCCQKVGIQHNFISKRVLYIIVYIFVEITPIISLQNQNEFCVPQKLLQADHMRDAGWPPPLI